MSKISKILSREILDSRGNPTVEVDLTLEDGSFARSSVPSGASTGKYEAVELRDGGSRYLGKGVEKAVSNVNGIIAEKLVGGEFDQNSLDEAMIALDGTPNKANLGANATLAVSMAFCRAEAISKKIPLYKHIGEIGGNDKFVLPVPMVLVLEGGKHADSSSDLQEYMIAPANPSSFRATMAMCSEIYQHIGTILKDSGYNINVGFEGAYGPALGSNEKVFEIIVEGIKKAGYTPGEQVKIAIDGAASELYKDGKYHLEIENRSLTSEEMIDFYRQLIDKYPIYSIEDGLAEDDWEGWKKMLATLGDKVQVMGDDLTVTNIERLQKAIDEKAINSILIKLNQIGTVSETIDAIKLAKQNTMSAIVSHRSGETEDSFIADLVVGMGTGQCKFGAPARSESGAKYNQLMRIEEELA
jgi:enolase